MAWVVSVSGRKQQGEMAKLTSKISVVRLSAGDALAVVFKYASGSCEDILKINASFELNLWEGLQMQALCYSDFTC